jgi:hypothetical protein
VNFRLFLITFGVNYFYFQAAGGGGETLFNTHFHEWGTNFSEIFCNFAPLVRACSRSAIDASIVALA